MEEIGPYKENAAELAEKLEQTLVDWLPEKLYNNRLQLSGGIDETGNGFEMWRRLHLNYMGDGEVLEEAGVECLRTYGQCHKMSEVSDNIDRWQLMSDKYGSEIAGAHRHVRNMFLNILPKELKSKILEEPDLAGKDYKALSVWVKRRTLILQKEALHEVTRKVLAKESGGKLHALSPAIDSQDEQLDAAHVPPPPIAPDVPEWARPLIAALSQQSRGGGDRGRNPRRTGSQERTRTPQRSPSSGRGRLIEWNNKCFHCGSDQHSRDKCPGFAKMLAEAPNNKGKPKKDWKPPQGYKSALGKARDAARALEAKKKVSVDSVVAQDNHRHHPEA